MATLKDWLTVAWTQGGMPTQLRQNDDKPNGTDFDSVRVRCARAGSLAITPGERLLELLRPNAAVPRRHSTAACATLAPGVAPTPTYQPTPVPNTCSGGFKYCPSDALPYCPPSRVQPKIRVTQPQRHPPPIPQRTSQTPAAKRLQSSTTPAPPPPLRKITTQNSPKLPPPVPTSPRPTQKVVQKIPPPPAPSRKSQSKPIKIPDTMATKQEEPQIDMRLCNSNPEQRLPETHFIKNNCSGNICIPPPPARKTNNILLDHENNQTCQTVSTNPFNILKKATTPKNNNQAIQNNTIPQSTKTTNVPPPINTNMANTQSKMHNSPSTGSKISLRQDSNVSSDSYSQTSSPSYTTKTMEAPLLPHHHINKSLNAKLVGRLNVSPKDLPQPNLTEDPSCPNSALIKSASTPASLQTIVRFQNGSNMSLHHRIIRDMRRPSASYSSHDRLKFRCVQVVVNAIALVAIAGGLTAYFKAYPTIQTVNKTLTTATIYSVAAPPIQQITAIREDRNPAPGICLPVIVQFCHLHRVPYNYTLFPNYVGHFGQRDAQTELEIYEAIVDVRCYELASLFLCSVFVPKCGPIGHMVRPCRSLCYETIRRCGFFLDVFGLTMPEYLQCDFFPESVDTDICVGYKEVREAKVRAQKPVCPSGFQCDTRRCIPSDWRCDGHVDCLDQSDEMNCRSCEKGMIHCGESKCIAQSHMCDGTIDCPWGQDERNCLRLSKGNGDVGRGRLELYRPQQKNWMPACVSHWDAATSPNTICSMLGYSGANSSRLATLGGSELMAGGGGKSGHGESQLWRMYQRRETNLLKEFRVCSATSSTVDLVCTDYVCGKTRINPKPTKRIVGGVEASPGDWPFLAAILGGPEEVFYCAGVLIADQWVLTAAHCVGNHSDVNGWTIQLGMTRRRAHAYYGQKVQVKKVVAHPGYNVGVAHDNDVALFQLTTRVTYHEYLLPVCLPPPTRTLSEGILCTVIGWGKRDDKDISEYEPAVNEVQVPVLNRELCNSWLEHRDLNVTEGMICAGYPEGGKDACQGDSGGPLLCRDPDDNSRWYVGGIVSWGIKCAHPRLPGVYAYVPKYVPWILNQITMYDDN